LYCAYAIDVFSNDFHAGALDSVLCAHTHMLPERTDGDFEACLSLAMDEILGAKAAGLKTLIKANYRPAWAVLPNAEATVLWLRQNLPKQADEIVARSRSRFELLSAGRQGVA
jgi:hypothetical protein